MNDKKKEAEYLSSEITKAEKSILDSDAEILSIQQKLEAIEAEITAKMAGINTKKRVISEIYSNNVTDKFTAIIEETSNLHNIVAELPSKRSKRQRRR